MAGSPEFYHRHLPHWQPKGAVFFLTFRLKFSLPGPAVGLLREQWRTGAASGNGGEGFVKWDSFLDQAQSGPRWLERADVAGAVSQALRDGDRRQYVLYAYCIMPNHVHAVLEPEEMQLSKVMRLLKGRTARTANTLLCREGAFWQDETYDRVIRDNNEFKNIIGYLLNNPVKAGLVLRWTDWPWTYCREGLI
jgi:REP element-mobilizing transposase RayT